MYSHVRTLDDESPTQVGPFRIPAVVEDERGVRLLLCKQQVTAHQWNHACELGIRGVVRMTAPTAYAPREVWSQHAQANTFSGRMELADKHWHQCEPGSYVEMRAGYEARNVGSNPFVHLHTHSEFSQLDGLATLEEISEAVLADGQSAVAVTDHGTCAGHPALQKMATASGIKPIFGIETYLVDDVAVREDQYAYWHLVLWAENDEGLRNLWGLSTAAFRDGFYGKPRVDWSMLQSHRSGLMVSTACLGGPVLKPLGKGDEALATRNLMRLGAIFGDDLYAELHTYDEPVQRDANRWLVETCTDYNIPMVAVVDAHYATPAQKDLHQIWLKVTTGGELFEGDHLLSADEVRDRLAYLPSAVVEESIKNTGTVADRCSAEVKPRTVMPIYTRRSPQYPTDEGRRQHDAERMLDVIAANWQDRVVSRGREDEHLERCTYEGGLLIDKKFPGYFLMVWDQVMHAKNNGVLVGPGRGSAAGSDIAYVMRITEVDPIEANLLVDRFLTPGRKSLPDFDIDYPSSKLEFMLDYIRGRWGEDHVARVGSHLRLQNKGAFQSVQQAIAERLGGDSFGAKAAISRIIDEAEASTAGLGLSWDELMAQSEEQLAEYRAEYPEWFEIAQAFRGRLRTYSKHAAGVIIDPDEALTDALPMRNGEPGQPMVTQFDFEALEWLGYIKFDFLSLRNLDTVQETLDEIRANRPDAAVDVYSWREEYADPAVYDELAQGWTMGVFQIETRTGTKIVREVQPQSIAELADCTTMGRPGPMRSGLDRLYRARRSGEESVHFADKRLEQVLDRTFGVMLYQEDIMALTMVLAGYDADEADTVRKILGKKKKELVLAEGRKFIERAVANQTDRSVAENLWAQMAEFALYSFNRAHAYSYATLAFWTAWFKVHYPREYITGVLRTLGDDDDIPRFVEEARRLGYTVLPPDINASKARFTGSGLEIRFGLTAISGIGDGSAAAALEGQPYSSYEDFIERKGPKCNIGHVRKMITTGVFDSLYPHRKALEIRVAEEAAGTAEICVFKDLDLRPVGPGGLPCHFDWDALPLALGKTGKPLKLQPARTPPKRCTKGCRQYTKPPTRDYTHLTPYTDAEIRELEQQMLGIYLSSSPFDGVPEDPDLVTANDLVVAEYGDYLLLGIVLERETVSRGGREWGRVRLATRSGECRPVLFSSVWSSAKDNLVKDSMVLCEMSKTDKGLRITSLNRLR